MRWFELFFLLIVGILFFCLGWEIWKKEKISLIHDYHHKKVKDSDKKAYTTIMGAYSARTAHPFQRNGAPFRFKLSKAQQVN